MENPLMKLSIEQFAKETGLNIENIKKLISEGKLNTLGDDKNIIPRSELRRYRRENDNVSMPKCSFCFKSQKEVKKLIAGPNNVYICEECIRACNKEL